MLLVSEEGKFLALDLGGTNFRILEVEFKNGKIVEVLVKHYEIADEIRLGSGVDLFDYIADCLSDFLKEKNLTEEKISLGRYSIF